MVVLLGPWGDVVPAKPVVDGDIGPNTPAILCECSAVGGAFIKSWGGLLGIKVGKSQQEIGETVTGGLIAAAKKRECSVSNQIRILLDFVPGVLKAGFDRVLAHDFGNRVAYLEGIVHLGYKEGLRPGCK